jgi:type VI secretion system Hcp family effector
MNKKLVNRLLFTLVIASIVVIQVIKTPEETVSADVLPTSDLYIEAYIEGIPGESVLPGYENWINVMSLDFSISQPESTPGPTRREGDIVFGDIVITKMLDKATVKLMEAVAQETIIPEVTIAVSLTPLPHEFYRYELTNVLVKSVQSTVSAMGDMYPTDIVTLGYEEITVIYTLYDSGGSSMGDIEWEYPQN